MFSYILYSAHDWHSCTTSFIDTPFPIDKILIRERMQFISEFGNHLHIRSLQGASMIIVVLFLYLIGAGIYSSFIIVNSNMIHSRGYHTYIFHLVYEGIII